MARRGVDFKKLDPQSIYHWMVQAVVPRPIAWVSTISESGIGNLAPFSYFNAVSSNPPILSISLTPKPDGEPKDTLKNIRQTGELVVHIVPAPLKEIMIRSSEEFPYGVDEMEKLGLKSGPSRIVKPRLLVDADIQMECRLWKEIQVGEGAGSATLVLVEILYLHVNEKVLDEKGRVLIDALDPLARLGGRKYARLIEI